MKQSFVLRRQSPHSFLDHFDCKKYPPLTLIASTNKLFQVLIDNKLFMTVCSQSNKVRQAWSYVLSLRQCNNRPTELSGHLTSLLYRCHFNRHLAANHYRGFTQTVVQKYSSVLKGVPEEVAFWMKWSVFSGVRREGVSVSPSTATLRLTPQISYTNMWLCGSAVAPWLSSQAPVCSCLSLIFNALLIL